MDRIKVTNTSIIVENYTMGESEQLEKPFRIYDPITHKVYYKGFYYNEENNLSFIVFRLDNNRML